MNRLKSNTLLKTIVCIIFIFSAAIFSVASLSVVVGCYMGVYSQSDSPSKSKFIQTDICKNHTENIVYNYFTEFMYTGSVAGIEDGLCITIKEDSTSDKTNAVMEQPYVESYYNAEGTEVLDIPSYYTNGKVENPGLEGSMRILASNNRYYTIEYSLEDPIPKDSSLYGQSLLYDKFFPVRYTVAYTAVIFGITSLISFLFLIFAAGHKKDNEGNYVIALNVLDKVPLDLYYLIAFFIGAFGVGALIGIWDNIYYYNYYGSYESYFIVFSLLSMSAVATVFLGSALTTATRLKIGGIWRNTICFKCIILCLKIIKKILSVFSGFFGSLSVTWGAVVFLMVIMFINASGSFGFAFIIDVIALLAVAKFAKMAVRLETAAEEMAKGNINFKINTASMKWRFKKHGENLNSINSGIFLAVEKQMKSERMKTELITNVSHDIKTPLTSIINYVDLLKKDHTPEEEKEYIDVLSRQSDRLKKLIDDLLEASKASTGNINVDMKEFLSSEIIYQSSAEYSDRFKNANLNVVISIPDEERKITADGRLLWRVLDNLFSNACKYAQSGTRVYVDLKQTQTNTIISVKNISKDQLNINADELMERFVRGDASRNTEGSGLGLNIAKSLVELQGGKFNLEIDGDLFKAEIVLNNK